MKGHKVLAINSWWAGILGTLLTIAIAGAATMAKGMYDAQANVTTDMAIIREQMKPIKDANLESRLTVQEQKVNAIQQTLDRVERQNVKMDDKLDKLIDMRLQSR